MSALLSLEGNNTESTDAVENAGKQIILVTGSVLGGAVLSSQTGNATEVSSFYYFLILQIGALTAFPILLLASPAFDIEEISFKKI